jgi:ubiquinone/menaquinone biosynthesis C-methylase UbiE
MTNDFYKAYAKYYDIINRNQDYDKQIAFIDRIFKRFDKVKRVLDVGCGTATHALLLEKKGYNVVGADASSDILQIARAKIKKAKSRVKVSKHDMRDLKFKDKFDGAICMFHTLNHLKSKREILKALKSVSGALRSGGIYIIDMGQYKIKNDGKHSNVQDSYEDRNLKLTVMAVHKFSFKDQCQYTKWIYLIDEKGKLSFKVSGIVNTKAISFKEMKELLSKAGFKLISAHNDYDLKSKFNPTKDKHMILIAQKE